MVKVKSKVNSILIWGDVFAGLKTLKPESVDCVITSPPYFDQRDYGFPNQIGNESSLDDYLSKLTYLFGILKDKLKPQGIFFLNIGDKYLAKYGNSPLGLIPYKLAFMMKEKCGWILEDTLIWYKPNHMPSSVKNRFANSYEPVFVFSKNSNNYYKHFKKSKSYTQVLSIILQQTKYSHYSKKQ